MTLQRHAFLACRCTVDVNVRIVGAGNNLIAIELQAGHYKFNMAGKRRFNRSPLSPVLLECVVSSIELFIAGDF
jgi:hypothetical protein